MVNTCSSLDHGNLVGGLTAGRLLEGIVHINSIGLPLAVDVKFALGTPGILLPWNLRLREEICGLNVAVDGLSDLVLLGDTKPACVVWKGVLYWYAALAGLLGIVNMLNLSQTLVKRNEATGNNELKL